MLLEYILKALPAIISGLVVIVIVGVYKIIKLKVQARIDLRSKCMSDIETKVNESLDKLVDVQEKLEKVLTEVEIIYPLKKGTTEILKFRLSRLYSFYYGLGQITQSDRDEFLSMADTYDQLGGNGTVPDMVKIIKALPIVGKYDKLPPVLDKG